MTFAKYARSNPGKHFGRFDIERLGVFTDPPRLSPLLKTIDKKENAKRPEYSRFQGAQFLTEPTRKITDTSDGYFDPVYRRIFKGEVIVRRKMKKDRRDKLILMPTNPAKHHSTPNDFYGCFTKYDFFRLSQIRKIKKKKKKKKSPANMTLAYPGYFNPYPEAL